MKTVRAKRSQLSILARATTHALRSVLLIAAKAIPYTRRMAKAIADPLELRRFAQDLHRFNAELQGQVSAMGAKLGSLQGTWKDQEQQKFAEEFDQTMKVLVKFIRVSEQHVPFLVRKAERLEEYLKQR